VGLYSSYTNGVDEMQNDIGEVESTYSEEEKLKLTKLFFKSLLIISILIYIPNLVLQLRLVTYFTWSGSVLIFAGIVGAVLAKLLCAFLFAWIYRIFSIFKKSYKRNTEIGWLFFGIFIALLATKGEGLFEEAATLIYAITHL
jgi:hypothetical protein